MARRLIVGFGLAALVAMPASAQTVDAVIAKNNEAKGGLARQKAVQSVRMTGGATVSPGIEAPIVFELKRPRYMRIDITVRGMTITQAYDGTNGWMLNPLSDRTMIRGTAQVSDTVLGDRKEVGGILRAHSIDTGQPGAPVRQTFTIEKIKLNVPLDDVRFAMPVKK